MKRGWGLLAFCSFLSVPSAAQTPRHPSVIRVCDDVQQPYSLNPYQIFSEKAHILDQQIFEGLIRFDSEGGIEPVLATRWERRDPLRMRFYLRPNVTFHDGEPLTAEAVKRSIERYVDPAVKSPAAGFLPSIERVDIIDDNTVDVVTRFPDGLLLNRLAAWAYICPISRLQKEGDEAFGRAPVGTGPFQFTQWREKEIELSAYRGYWNRGFPRSDKLVFLFIPAERQVDALLGGEIDILTSLPGTRTLEVQRNPDTTVLKKPTLYTVAASFNTNHKPLSNKRIRQALNMCVNKEKLIRYDLLGNGRLIASLSIPGEFGHNPHLRPYPYRPDLAKKILAEEGYPNGFELDVFLKVNAQRTGQIIAMDFAKIGVKLNLTLVPDADIFKYLENPDRWDMLLADCPDPMYHGAFIPSAFLYSRSPFVISKNAEFDKRLETAIQTLDVKEQEARMQELDRFVYEEALALFTYQRIRTYGVNRAVEFTPYTSGMHYFLSSRRKPERN